jgi:hypothetical protein
VTKTFADLVNEAMARKRTPEGKAWSDYTLSAAIGLLPGDKSFNAKQVWRLRRGERQNLTRPLVARLIEVLSLDPDEAWAAAEITPPGFKADHFRKLEFFATGANKVMPGRHGTLRIVAGQSARPTVAQPPEGDFDKLISHLRPQLVAA